MSAADSPFEVNPRNEAPIGVSARGFGEQASKETCCLARETPMRNKRVFDREFKLQVVRQLARGEKGFAHLCREHALSASLLRRWKELYEAHGENAWLPETSSGYVERDAEARIAALEAALGRAHLEIEFLRHCLKTLEKGGSRSNKNGS